MEEKDKKKKIQQNPKAVDGNNKSMRQIHFVFS